MTGSLTLTSSDGSLYAYLRDYQGNMRSVVYISGNKALEVQHNEYYPYGLPTAETNSMIDNDYRYGGKEFDIHNGLNTYDFGARSYTPDIARFWQPDPLAHDYN